MDKFKFFSIKKSTKSGKPGQESKPTPAHWAIDEIKVREGKCCFPVKYLGCTEVFESRGLHVCEEAVKLLRANAKKSDRFSFRKKPKHPCPVLADLYISGDSLRVVENRTIYEKVPAFSACKDDSQTLLIDQTIEKVSFCAPDRNNQNGFAYICRDGTTKRWMCHGFHAVKESGERLSHAVGCAFAVCLERKQQREKDAVEVVFSLDKTSFTRTGSFRQASLTERLQDPQSTKLVEPQAATKPQGAESPSVCSVERPRPSLIRQSSSSDYPKIDSTPFKRYGSLRLDELPSTLQRQASSLDSDGAGPKNSGDSAPKEAQPVDRIAELCQQLTVGLSSLSNPFSPPHVEKDAIISHPQNSKNYQAKQFMMSSNLSNGVIKNEVFTGNFEQPRSFHEVTFSPTNPFYSQHSRVPNRNTNPFLSSNTKEYVWNV